MQKLLMPVAVMATLFSCGSGSSLSTDGEGMEEVDVSLSNAIPAELPAVGRALEFATLLAKDNVTERDSVYIQVNSVGLAFEGTEAESFPVAVHIETTRFLRDTLDYENNIVLETKTATGVATATGFVIHAGEHTFTITGNEVKFTGPSLVDDSFPNISQFTALVETSSRGKQALALAYEDLIAPEKIDNSGYWKGQLKDLVAGDITVHCSKQKGSTQSHCEARYSGSIVELNGSHMAIQSVARGADALRLINALPKNRPTLPLRCGTDGAAARCVVNSSR